MTDRRELNDTILRANEAKRVLENPELVQGFRSIEDELYLRWRNTNPLDTEAREALWFEQHGLDLLRKQLTKPVDEGKFAQKALDQLNYQARLE